MRLLTECRAAFAASAAAAGCPRLRPRCSSRVVVASEAELRAAVAQGGEVVVKAGVTIELQTTLHISVDCTIVGERGGTTRPTLRVDHGHLIRSSKNRVLRVEGLRLVGGCGGAWGFECAVYSTHGKLELRDCSMTAAYGVYVGNGCVARVEGGVVEGCSTYGLIGTGSTTRVEAVGVTIQGCGVGIGALNNATVTVQRCTFVNNTKDHRTADGGGIVRN
jgi:hypothetical protein